MTSNKVYSSNLSRKFTTVTYRCQHFCARFYFLSGIRYKNGAHKSTKTESNLALLADFLYSFAIVPVDESIAAVYGEVKEQLRSKGINIPENDVWIAASAKSRHCRLLTFDSHFKSVDGLTVVS